MQLGLDDELSARVDAFRAELDHLLPKNALTDPDILRMLIVRGLDAAAAAKAAGAQMPLALESPTQKR